MANEEIGIPAFIEKVVEFPDGTSYKLQRPLTTFRGCHDGVPAEGRIVFTCSRIDLGDRGSEEYIMKIKARYQWPQETGMFQRLTQ
jgi:hypothetical protein